MLGKSLPITNRERPLLKVYKHARLENADENIRLLRFLPVLTALRSVQNYFSSKLCDAPPYKALSYTWDPSGHTGVEIELRVERTKSSIGRSLGVSGIT